MGNSRVIKIQSCFRGLLLGVLVVFPALAFTADLGDYLSSMNRLGLLQPYMKEGVQSIRKVVFDLDETDSGALFYGYNQSLHLRKTLEGSRGGLRPFAEIDVDEVGIIAHEVWHAFRSQRINAHPSLKRKYFSLLQDSPFKEETRSAADEILDEMVGNYIGHFVHMTAFFVRAMKKNPSAEYRDTLIGHLPFKNRFVEALNYRPQGYYHNFFGKLIHSSFAMGKPEQGMVWSELLNQNIPRDYPAFIHYYWNIVNHAH